MATKKRGDMARLKTITETLGHVTRDFGNQNCMTSLNVDCMCVSTDEIAHAVLWLEDIALENKPGASHALALCFWIEVHSRSFARSSRVARTQPAADVTPAHNRPAEMLATAL